MIKPKYKIGDVVIVRVQTHLIMEKISKGYIPSGGKAWEYYISNNGAIGWIKEGDIIAKIS